ncbi:hypothetical protein LSTR_LSTR004455 [Laodelphax striatellus]|uniref:CSN8/PSMD8/EIF3K domain-containing protein n=1 Tax=Laodelphax striatellus TaxID=195883 RepID=A0A482X9Y0_LAOST|nr:hypothetical protein LSTR_LSTR004455 [Laodelphax striatellus]
MVPENINTLGDELEKQELDAPGGIPPPQVYAKLLAIYLYRNDLCNAKYLWKRIPPSSKSSYPELNQIWEVGKAMWQRDLPAVYSTIQNTPWSENIVNIMKALHEEVQKRATELVGRAYSSLSVDTFSALVGVRPEEAVKVAAQQHWQVDNGLVIPTRPVISTPPIASSEDQLYKLTDFVSFLEN